MDVILVRTLKRGWGMKKFFVLVLLSLGLMLPGQGFAQPAVIEDIKVIAQNILVDIIVQPNQALQFETFKNEESSTDYIVMDFLGTVYTDLPSVIDVRKGGVEKVNLVRGESKTNDDLGSDFYTIDFIAINLSNKVDYEVVKDSKSIKMSIRASQPPFPELSEKVDLSGGMVELEPPIVVDTQEPEPPLFTVIDKQTIGGQAPIVTRSRPEPVTPPQEEKAAPRRRGLFGVLFGWIGSKPKPEPEAGIEAKSVSEDPVVYSSDAYIIDRIVSDTQKKKERIDTRIESLSDDLRQLQEQLQLSKGQKQLLEGKINEILAKLDQLQNALEEEIRRRQALGEAVGDLLARRDAYVQAKKNYELLSRQLGSINAKVDTLNLEVNNVKSRLNGLQFEKMKLEEELNLLNNQYGQIRLDYKSKIDARKQMEVKVENLNLELERLAQVLEKTMREKESIVLEIDELEKANKLGDSELDRIKSILIDKNSLLLELSQRYETIKQELEAAMSEKYKIEYAHRNAKAEYERIQREIERFLGR